GALLRRAVLSRVAGDAAPARAAVHRQAAPDPTDADCGYDLGCPNGVRVASRLATRVEYRRALVWTHGANGRDKHGARCHHGSAHGFTYSGLPRIHQDVRRGYP